MLVTSSNGSISISCSLNGESVAVYTTAGTLIATTVIENGTATIPDSSVKVEEGKDVVIDVTDTDEKAESVVIGAETVDKIADAAQEFVAQMGHRRVFAFYGGMGAGKTTFIKSLCEELGVEDTINSPTFAIVNEYEDREANTIFHFDFYRIKSITEVYNMGYEEYFYSNAYCFIEWPELIEELLPEETVKVTIEEQPDGSREVRF